MSNTRAGNVIRVDTSANFTDVRNIVAVKLIGATNVTASEIKITKAVDAADGSGSRLWDNGNTIGANDRLDVDLDIRVSSGVYVTVAHSAVVYIYLK